VLYYFFFVHKKRKKKKMQGQFSFTKAKKARKIRRAVCGINPRDKFCLELPHVQLSQWLKQASQYHPFVWLGHHEAGNCNADALL